MGDIHLQYKNGHWYFSCGASLNEKGERKHKKHCLGKDRQLATRKAQSLSWTWDAEKLTDPATGLKIWSPGAIEAAVDFVTTAVPTPAIAEPPKAQPVSPAEVYIPPPPAAGGEPRLPAEPANPRIIKESCQRVGLGQGPGPRVL